jgi:hypothetical protein
MGRKPQAKVSRPSGSIGMMGGSVVTIRIRLK